MLISAYWYSVGGCIWCHGGYRLPLILWERVIDELSLPMGEEFWHPQSLRACAAVCRGWHPRARCKLWRTTMIRTGSQASKLLDLIDDDPQLGQLILELQIYPARPGKELGCVSFHLPKLTSALPNLRLLCMKRVNWVCNPRTHSGPLAQFRALAVLHLWFARFRTVADFLRLVWSLRSLRHLVIHGKMFIEKPLSDEDALRLSVLRNPKSCDKLAKIEVGVRSLCLPSSRRSADKFFRVFSTKKGTNQWSSFHHRVFSAIRSLRFLSSRTARDSPSF